MRLYFIGICGTAMGNAALLLRQCGHEVLGCDTAIYPPMSDHLRAAGIGILDGYDADRLARLAPDLVVVGNAISRGNPELEWLLDERAIPYVSLPQLLREQVLARRHNVVVSGTHGKTTTTTLAAFLLLRSGRNPGYLIGGVPRDLPSGSEAGDAADPFVIEGDEYDSAFFDKRSKFIHYLPNTLLVNNLEFDHGDIFRDLADVRRTFNHLLRTVPRKGRVVINGDDPEVATLDYVFPDRVVRVGTGAGCDVRIEDFREGEDEGSSFRLTWKGRPWTTVRWSLPGLYNARNAAMAATGAALSTGLEDPAAFDISALAEFKGVRRRQEVLAHAGGVTVVEDFGHHPGAIRQTLASLRARHPGHFITAAFEPRSNTARSEVFQRDFAECFDDADRVLVGALHRLDKLPPDKRLDTARLSAELAAKGHPCTAFADNAALLATLKAENPVGAAATAGRPRLVVFFSNGSFDGIISGFARHVREAAPAPAP